MIRVFLHALSGAATSPGQSCPATYRSILISEFVARILALAATAICTWLWLTGPASPGEAFTPRALVIGLAIGTFAACAWMPERIDESIHRLGASGLIRGFGLVGLAILAGVLYAVSGR